MTTQTSNLPPKIGRFKVKKLLGSGTYGQVYLATDPNYRNREVAVKVPDGHGLTTEGRERFRREAAAAQMFNHPNLCKVLETGAIAGLPFIVMEYVPGESLEDVLAERRQHRVGPFPLIDSAQWVRTLALAMHTAHTQGVIHRDLKPGNIVLNKQTNHLVIVDFGLAMLLAAHRDARMTQGGRPLGTVLYMPPEQAAGEWEKVGERSDIYSLGSIFYELITGRNAYSGTNPHLILADLLRKDPNPPSYWHEQVTTEVDEICLRAMARRPEDRYPTARDFAAALGDFIQRNGVNPDEGIVHLEEAPGENVPTAPATKNFGTGSLALPDVKKTSTGKTLPPNDEHKTKEQLAPGTIPPNNGVAGKTKPGITETDGHQNKPTLPTPPKPGPIVFDDHIPKPVQVNWGEVLKTLCVIGALFLIGLVVVGVSIKLNIVNTPSWAPEFLWPEPPPPPPTNDRSAALWVLQEKMPYGKLFVRLGSDGPLVLVTKRSDLEKLPSNFEIVEMTLSRSPVTDVDLSQELAKLPSLRKLELTGWTQPVDVNFLNNLPGLESLNLNTDRLAKNASLQGLANLRPMPKLKELSLNNRDYTPAELSALLDLLPNLESLSVGGARASQLTERICDQFVLNAKLKVLNLPNAQLTNELAKKLLRADTLRGKNDPGFLKLDFSGTTISNDAFHLADDDRTKPLSLETLILSDCKNIAGEVLEKLTPDLYPRLKDLYLNRLPLRDEHLSPLGKLKPFRTLHLSNCKDITGRSLALVPLARDASLWLDGTSITDESLASMGWEKGTVSLKQLNLARTNVTSIVKRTPMEFGRYKVTLLLPTVLNELYLGDVQLTDDAIDLLPELKQLKVLGISGPRLTNATLSKITQKIRKQEIAADHGLPLEELDLSQCSGLTDESGANLGQLRLLKRLRLTGATAISEVTRNGLRASLSECEVIE